MHCRRRPNPRTASESNLPPEAHESCSSSGHPQTLRRPTRRWAGMRAGRRSTRRLLGRSKTSSSEGWHPLAGARLASQHSAHPTTRRPASPVQGRGRPGLGRTLAATLGRASLLHACPRRVVELVSQGRNYGTTPRLKSLTAITLDCLEHKLHPHGAVPAGQHQHVCHHRVATAEVEREREPQRRGRGRLHCWRRQHQVRHE